MKQQIQEIITRDSRDHAVVFYFVQETGENRASIGKLKDFTPIHAGFQREGSISIDYDRSAELIVEHLSSLHGTGGTQDGFKIVLPWFTALPKGHPLEVRQGLYVDLIKERTHFEVDRLELKYVSENDSTDDDGIKAIEKKIAANDAKTQIVAILGRSHAITLEVIRLVKAYNRGPVLDKRDPGIYVFAENITTDLLIGLNDESEPLQAICSADPYYMGRYIVRAALNELMELRKRRKKVIRKSSSRDHHKGYGPGEQDSLHHRSPAGCAHG